MFSRERLYIHIPIFKLIGSLDQFLKLNLNCEIYIDSGFIDHHSEKDIEIINSSFKKYGLFKKMHGPFSDLNPGSYDNKIRRVSLERFLQALELCRKFNSDSLTLHSHFEPVFYARHFKEWLDNSKEIWKDLSRQAKRYNLSIYIENSIDNSPRAVIEILKTHPYFGACFDVAHYNVFNPKGWKGAIKEYPPGSIKEVHLSDNKGDEDTHLVLGEGNINFEDFFNELNRRNENPIFTIEPHSLNDLAKSLKFIQKYNKQL